MGKVIFQAGVDFETRPMVILSSSALPDPQEVSYDLLLQRILAYLDLFVESDYTVVFFAAGGRYAPNWNWVWKAYRSLSRKYRKNLKRLLIVHSSFFSKMLFSLAGAVVSPKFFRKIVYVDTLSELATQVPLTQIDIPPAVYKENLKQERHIVLPTPIRSSVFGVPLEELMGHDGEKGSIPRVLKDSIQDLLSSGLNEEGIFRRSPSSVLLKQVQEAYDRGQVVSLQSFNDPHLAAVLLKKYLRDLPNPPFPESLYPDIRRCPTPSNDSTGILATTYIRDTLLPQLMPCMYILLSNIFYVLHEVSLRSNVNRMDAHNLAVVICPNLVKSSDPMQDVILCSIPSGPSMSSTPSTTATPTQAAPTSSTETSDGGTTLGSIVKLCIQRYYEIFDEVHDRAEVVPPSTRRSPSPPSSEGSSGSQLKQSRPLSLRSDDEDIDDAMLVMPIGPSGSGTVFTNENLVSVWGSGGADADADANVLPYQPRRRNLHGARNGGRGNENGVGFVNDENRDGAGHRHRSPARSTISIEHPGSASGSGGGSISIGRGALRKASGSGVEAMGITAGGFFTAPGTAPPVPTPRKRRAWV
ncbi:Rho GTPase activation protein [Suillus subaureus]|uniref:Rho GTPase activation protein n=1 Tax=Suillus subaureus TaxID=48587 RepID=A0A9P7EDZ2_9AGAM|nr:Rho GTPase activation protein [Suillus subaureus]KAG1818634.1 Rho GTPase activation protein [Suillus subaureus]